ncbi:hypothetical protein RclHR1_05490018 [Rhizophagus clarus]|uniref:Uncharacterized protein n=1 Tax=Rhizophagus clarus TaxID=94130 RepID=A0A2Z6RZZ3_9GLOM|nr:hypothetical protein RclHR1_05490018 [Rhizophagus clarus]
MLVTFETPLEADYMIFRRCRTPLGADYDILKSGTPLEADYDISKIQTFHFEDWTLFEDKAFDLFFLFYLTNVNECLLTSIFSFLDLVTIFEDYFEGPDEAQTPFKGLGLPETLRNFKGLRLLDEDFEGLRFSLGTIIFSHFDAFCWIKKVKSCLLESNQLEQYLNH